LLLVWIELNNEIIPIIIIFILTPVAKNRCKNRRKRKRKS
jgi:hypothetical protein